MKNLFTILSFFLASNSYSTNYYFNALGNDGNAGTLAAPWKSLAKFNSVFASKAPGDSFLLNRGDIFYGNIIISRSGSSGSPIVIGAYGTGADPVVTGLTSIVPFTNLGSNIWESSFAVTTLNSCNMVLISGVNTPVGRFPNTGYLPYQGFTTTTKTSTSLNSSTTNWTGAVAVTRKNNWIMDNDTITAHVGTMFTHTYHPNPNTYAGTAGYGFFIERDVRTLDTQNEWYFVPVTKKLRIYSTVMPASVQVATIDTLVFMTNRSFITFDHIYFKGSNKITMCINANPNLTIQYCHIDYSGQEGIWGAVNGAGAANFRLLRTTINHSNNNGLILRENFTGALIQRDTILNTGMQAGMGGSGDYQYIAMRIFADNVTTEYNRIDSVGYTACYELGNNMLRRFNYISHFCMTKMDGGGLYTWLGGSLSLPPTAKTGCIDSNNIVIDASAATAIAGTTSADGLANPGYWDANTQNYKVYNNLFANCGGAGAYIYSGTSNNFFLRNTCYNNNITQLLVTNQFANGFASTNNTVKNNFLFSKTATQYTGKFTTRDALTTFTPTMGTFDSNYYARPLSDNLTILTISQNNTITGNYNLAQWQTVSGKDGVSKKSPLTITSTGQLFLYYNPTDHDSTVSVVNGVDVTNASYSGTVTLHQFTSLVLMSTGSLVTPTITWGPLTAIPYLTAISVTQLGATTGIPGTYAYSIGGVALTIGTVLPAGTYSITVIFTPTDPTSYTTATKTVTLVVNPAAETLAYTVTSKAFTGASQLPTVVTTPPGLATSTTLDGVTGGKVLAGSYASITGNTDPNYTATPISGTFTITPAPATIGVGNLVQVYDSTLKVVNISTNPAGLATITTFSHPPLRAGNDTVIVRLNDPNYAATPDTVILVILKATPTLTSWIPATPIIYGTALTSAQFDAIFNKPGVTTYTPVATTVPNAGPQTIQADFVPTDTTDYNSVLGVTVGIVVNKATAVITVADTVQNGDGLPKHVTPVATPNVGAVTVLYGGSPTQPSSIGDHPFTVTFSDANYTAVTFSGTLHITSNVASIFITNFANRPYTGSAISVTVTCLYSFDLTYDGSHTAPSATGVYTVIGTINDGSHIGADTVLMTIIKGTPSYTWPTPANGVYGLALSGTQLNLTSPVSGSTAYLPGSGTVPPAGTLVIAGVFTPSDTANWNIITASVTMTITKAIGSFTVTNLSQVYDSTLKSVKVVSVPSGLGGIVVKYNGDTSLPRDAASSAVNVHNTNPNYNIADFNGTLAIAKGASNITWSKPGQLVFPAPLTTLELDATANHDGVLTYTPALGAIFSPGAQQISVLFVPTNSNYNIATKTVSISIIGNSQGTKFFYYNGHFYFIKK